MPPTTPEIDYPAVTLIVLNWNARDFLPACLHSLSQLDYPHYDIVVVDNGSDDGSAEWVASQFPHITLIQTQSNRGFAYGNNVALRQLKTEFAVLVNPDVVVASDWLQNFLRPILADATIGVAGCKLTYADGLTVQHSGGYLLKPQAFPRQTAVENTDDQMVKVVRDVEYVIGAAMLIRRAVLAEIGLFDEGFFLYFEDADFCARARRAGYRVVYVPAAQARHFESATTQSSSHFYFTQMFISRWRYLLKHLDDATLLAETVPAEAAWLASLHPFHGSAAAYAYQATLHHLPQILAARLRDGQPAFAEQQAAALKDALGVLRARAWQPAVAKLAVLSERAVVQTRPFTSPTPLLGPLLARLRQAWNGVATADYVRPLLVQQNAFNLAAVQQFQAQATRLLTHEAVQNELTQDVIHLQTQLQETYRLLNAIQARLVRLAGQT